MKKKFWEKFRKFVSLFIMINRVIDTYTKECLTYHHEDWYWVINPNTKEWVVCVSDTGYTFFNRDYWNTLSRFYPSDDVTNDIKNWVLYKLKTPESEHCYPDYINGDYDWRDEFDPSTVLDVIENGKLISND